MRKVIALLIGLCLCLCLGFGLAEEGRLVEEQPGSDPSDDGGLTLELDNGDQEYTVYTGSKEYHLGFWGIQDYGALSEAWGGAPGWSVVPAEESADIIGWSNSNVNTKSLWILYDTGETAVAGDYAAVLTCFWHGQSASAGITVHVVDAPNGPLEGITVPEEEYTLTVGEALTVDLQKEPADWTLPGEQELLYLNSVRSGIDDDFTYKKNGDPYIHVNIADSFGPVTVTAWRSGTYTIYLRYQCGSFTESIPIRVNVLNEDGTLPEKAEDVTVLEDVYRAALEQAGETDQSEPEQSGTAEAPGETGQTEEEQPGNDPSDDGGLKLALDKGDEEFTIYAGSHEVHLSFWDIQDYETLSAAWGGAPGWSIQPAEGSADVVRWSNASGDGKSLWAFYYTEAKAAAGDYEAVLTCSWHGQSASARVKVHVVDSPNGALEGISGMEEEYTLTLGDSVTVNLETIPAGWTLPGEQERLSLTSAYSELEEENTRNEKGNPYVNVSPVGTFGPVTITAWRSGTYRLRFNYVCGTFSEELYTTIRVLNQDGSMPQKAEEITELETGAWSYDTAVNTETGEQYAVLTGGKIQKNMVLPAEVDGLPVRVIGGGAFWSSNTQRASETIETLEIPEGVLVVDQYAFKGCTGLKSVILPESLLSIGYSAFEDCRSLTEIRIPSGLSLNYIYSGAFSGVAMEDIVLADGTSLMQQSLNGDWIYFSAYADGWYYLKLEDGTAKLIEYQNRDLNTGEIVIPETVGGLPVSTLKENLFYGYSNITKVVLPESLRVIEKNAFRNCESLKEINLPSGLQEVGPCAFVNIGAEGLTLPEGAKENSDILWYTGRHREDSTGSWEYGILEDGTAVVTRFSVTGTKVSIPAEVDGIPVTGVARASREPTDWESLGKITEAVLPEGLKFIGISAFENMDMLQKVSIPEGVTLIGRNSFSSCSALTSVTLPESLLEIGDGAFRYTPLAGIKFPAGLVSIGSEAFQGHNLKEIDFPAGVRTIGNRAFSSNGRSTLKKVSFRNPLTETGKGLFGYISSGSDLYNDSTYRTLSGYGFSGYHYLDNPDSWRDVYADSRSGNQDVLTIACYPGSTADQKYQYNVKKEYLSWGEEAIRTAPADRVVGPGLWQPDEFIYELVIPEGVEEIAEGAFANMKTLCKVTLPASLKSIGNRAFEGCGALKEIVLPDNVEFVGTGAFKDCASLEKASLPKAVTVISDSLFENCKNLSTLKTGAKELTGIGSRAFKNCKVLTKLDLKKGLTEIGGEAFSGTGLKKAVIPDTVTHIGNAAFAFSSITSITLPAGLGEIPDNLCYGATDLKDIKIPASVTRIGSGAFAYCSPASLKLPEGLVSIGEEAFLGDAQGVQGTYVYTGGRMTYCSLKALKLPASLQEIGKNAFAANDALTSITFAKGSQLVRIGDSAFGLCLRLKEITLPDSVQSVGAYAFVNCLAMQKADLGDGVTSIGEKAFMYDDALTSLKVPDTAVELGDGILEGHGSSLTVICVEGSAMEKYIREAAPDVTISYPKSR